MNIEKNEYFAVVRGFELSSDGVLGYEGDTSTKVRTDRSHEGIIYQAIEINGPLICAKIVFSNLKHFHPKGAVRMINTLECEVWPLTKEFVELCASEKTDEIQ